MATKLKQTIKLKESSIREYVSLAVFNSDSGMWLLNMQDEEMLPPVAKTTKNGWKHTIKNLLMDMIGIEPKVVNMSLMVRFWQGNEEASIFNSVFHVVVTNEQLRKRKVTENASKVTWKTIEEINKSDGNSPEFGIYFMNTNERENSLKILEPHTTILGNSFIEVLKDNIIVTPQNLKDNQEHLILGVGWSEADQVSVAKHFMQFSMPYIFMRIKQFKGSLPPNHALTESQLHNLFKAADISNRGVLCCKEYMCLMAFLEPVMLTQQVCLEAQAKYIFRFIDKQKRNIWIQSDIENFFNEINKKSKKPTAQSDITKLLRDVEVNGNEIPMAAFIKAVGSGKVKIPTDFLKFGQKVIERIGDGSSQRQSIDGGGRAKLSVATVQSENIQGVSRVTIAATGDKRSQVPAERKVYSFAGHVIKIGKGGYLDHTTMDKMAKCSSPSATKNLVVTKKSLMGFSTVDNPAQEILMGLKFFTGTQGTTEKPKEPFTWEKVENQSFAKLLIQLSGMAEDIMKLEPRLIYVPAPAIILGDIHGNFVDLHLFESALWPSGLHLTLGNVLFLGDYVDRGQFGTEVVAYLFATKVKNPTRLNLVRGNHEIRQVQRQFTFYNECLKKFGKDLGQDVWKAVNNAFDCMPLAAVVDNELFCCHGGVPPPWLCPTISVINNIPVPLPNPEAQSALAWELLWNDPVRDDVSSDPATMTELSMNDGFAVNKRRGTAHMFTTAALNKFLKINNLSYAVRAHEVVDCGFKIQQGSKLTTIFSTSYYSGMCNKAACIIVQDQKIRIFHLHSDDFHKEERKQAQQKANPS